MVRRLNSYETILSRDYMVKGLYDEEIIEWENKTITINSKVIFEY